MGIAERGKKGQEDYRLQHQVGKIFGTLPVAELWVTVSAVFQPKYSNTACSDLFIYLIYGTHTNLSMHRHEIFQHSYTFVRQHDMFREKKATYILQWLFHTCNWCKNLFFLLIMRDISRKCTWVVVKTLPLPTIKHNLVAFVNFLFQCWICFSFNYIWCVRMSIIIPTSF